MTLLVYITMSHSFFFFTQILPLKILWFILTIEKQETNTQQNTNIYCLFFISERVRWVVLEKRRQVRYK